MKNKKLLSTNILLILVSITVVLAAFSGGCSSNTENGENQGEHGADSEEGEESGDSLALNDVYDTVRKGARLIMSYDAQSNAFVGTVENTTTSTLKRVRVEVHLSNGMELGPTTPVDLAPGEKINVTLQATSQAFDGWTPHAEVGAEN